MYKSLTKNCSNFHLYIFAFDNETYSILKEFYFPNVTVVSLKEFEDEELLHVKPTRTATEYCWTCTPSTILYAIQKFGLDNCTYVDADLFFYSNPKVLIEEMGHNSVSIIEHRYTPEYDRTTTSGKYCVQFMTFKNDTRGMIVLNWWRTECIKWCYAYPEDGKLGDQKYLDDWTTRFKGVYELRHIGGGVAPWNLQQYVFIKKRNKIYLKSNNSEKNIELIFFHFHYLKFFLNNIIQIAGSYYISNEVVKYLYFPYFRILNEITKKNKQINNSFDPNGAKELSPYNPYVFKDKIHLYKRSILKLSYNSFIHAREEIKAQKFFYLNSV